MMGSQHIGLTVGTFLNACVHMFLWYLLKRRSCFEFELMKTYNSILPSVISLGSLIHSEYLNTRRFNIVSMNIRQNGL